MAVDFGERYEVIKRLGKGGMGEVWLAQDKMLPRKIALKVLSPEASSDETLRQRFRREAEIGATLDHPNICHLYEVGATADGRPFLAIQYVQGVTLDSLIGSASVSLSSSLLIGTQISHALAEAHRCGVIHRDIKPSNIAVSTTGRIVVLDFGVARVLPSPAGFADAPNLTDSDGLPGTLMYMSPEQMSGEEVGPASDLYSLGVTLFELVTGQFPFPTSSVVAFLDASRSSDPISFPHECDLPLGLQTLLSGLLQKDPAARPGSAEAVHAALTQLNAALDSAGSPPREQVAAFPREWFDVEERLGTSVHVGRVGDPEQPRNPSIAILPFSSIGEWPHAKAFCDGLVETLASRLTRAKSRVGGRYEVVPFMDVREQGVLSPSAAKSAFDVDYALSGSVQRLDESLRVALNLTDVAAQRQVDSGIVTVRVDSTTVVQDTIVERVLMMLGDETVDSLSSLPTLTWDPAQGASEEGTRSDEDATEVMRRVAPPVYGLYLRGLGYLQDPDDSVKIDLAVAVLEESVRLDPKFAPSRAGLARAYLRKHRLSGDADDMDLAVLHSVAGLELDGESGEVLSAAGEVNMERGQADRALEQLQRAVDIDPQRHLAWSAMANIHYQKGDHEKAEALYRKSLEVQPESPQVLNVFGSFLLRIGSLDRAIETFRLGTHRFPLASACHSNLGGALYQAGRLDDAKRSLEKAFEIRANGYAASNLGTLAAAQGRVDEAIRWYRTATTLDSNRHLYWGNLASLLKRTGETVESGKAYYEAIRLVKERLEVGRTNPSLRVSLADYYAFSGKAPEAAKTLRRVIEDGEVPSPLQPMVVSVLEKIGDREGACDWALRAIEGGNGVIEILTDPDLERLREDPRVAEALRASQSSKS